MRHLLFLLRSTPRLTDRWGYHVRPIHYYDPLPDFRTITPAQTQARRVSAAIDFDLPAQIELQRQISGPVGDELRALAAQPEPEGFSFVNPYFSALDAAVYYALLRHLKPAKVIEIGCGYSTRIADRALKRNREEGAPGKLVCIEPYPEPRLTEHRLEMELIEKPVEEVPLSMFEGLAGNDVLFIDSSHVAKFRSDVLREFLDILPVIQPGVWMHVHDIFFPHDYPTGWLMEKRIAFNEQYLLEAFLAFNPVFKPRCALRWLWLEHRKEMSACWPAACLPPAEELGAASFWMQRVR
ncbi:MAG: class I SAM-dependent methyltransferase [Limisphaerales bacterium]